MTTPTPYPAQPLYDPAMPTQPAMPNYTPPGTGTYPPARPVTYPSSSLITVDAFLRDAARVERVIQDITYQRFLADRIYSPGPQATGGAVIYDQAVINELYSYRDVQPVAPGQNFPIVTDANPTSLVAKVTKWGGAFWVTYEERDRDRRDVLQRQLTKLRNTLVRKVDGVAVGALRNAPVLTAAAAGVWTNPAANIQADVSAALTKVDKLDMGYMPDIALASPATINSMTNNDNLLRNIYYAGPQSPVASPIGFGAGNDARFRGLLGLNWYASNRVGDNEVFLLSSGTAGSISDEGPGVYSRVVDQPEQERVLVMAARKVVPYVTEPKSVVLLTGVGS